MKKGRPGIYHPRTPVYLASAPFLAHRKGGDRSEKAMTSESKIFGIKPLVVVTVIGCAVLVVLAATSQRREPDAATEIAAPAAIEQQVLLVAGTDVVPLVAAVGNAWRGPKSIDRLSYNASLQQSRRMVGYAEGSITVDRDDGGNLVKVVLRSGVGDRCGEAGSVLAGGAEVLRLSGEPIYSDNEFAQLKTALSADDGNAEFQRGRALVRAIGGCIKTLLVKAI